jgi:hypothetical protein
MGNIPSSWEDLVRDLASALGTAYKNRNDATFWTAQLESGSDPAHSTKHGVSVSSVKLEITGLEIVVKDGTVTQTWHASPGQHGHPITFNGVKHDEASLVYRYAGSPANPVRFHLDIRWVKDGAIVYRLDTEFPKNP